MDPEIVAELAALRRGRGVRRPAPGSWIGPRLTDLLSEHASSSKAEDVRRALLVELHGAIQELPMDLAKAYAAAVALTHADQPFLGDRLAAVGARQDRSPRTVQRHLARADEILAAALVRRRELRAAEDAIVRRGWQLDQFSVELRLDLPRPVHRTRRVMRVTAPSLSEVTDVFGLPQTPDDSVRVEALEGCTLVESVRLSESLWRSRFRLPRTVLQGETHAFGVSIEVPSVRDVEPMVIMTPARVCRHFRCRIVVGDSGARQFERIEALPSIAVHDSSPVGPILDIDSGAVEVEFVDLTPGLAYGVRWAI